MKRFFTPIFATLLLAQFTPIYAAVSAKPNIIFILADDLGFAEIGANGADHYRTPNIDSIARAGVRFSHFTPRPSAVLRARSSLPVVMASAREQSRRTPALPSSSPARRPKS